MWLLRARLRLHLLIAVTGSQNAAPGAERAKRCCTRTRAALDEKIRPRGARARLSFAARAATIAAVSLRRHRRSPPVFCIGAHFPAP
jgi:hypothetical protein